MGSKKCIIIKEIDNKWKYYINFVEKTLTNNITSAIIGYSTFNINILEIIILLKDLIKNSLYNKQK